MQRRVRVAVNKTNIAQTGMISDKVIHNPPPYHTQPQPQQATRDKRFQWFGWKYQHVVYMFSPNKLKLIKILNSAGNNNTWCKFL